MAGYVNRDANRMVRRQLRTRGISDPRVIEVMGRVPRHLFVTSIARRTCYDDRPVPIGFGQTMSQPFIVGLMTELLALSGRERVLEVGTGSGYQTAILAELAAKVWSIELIPALQQSAQRVLTELGYSNICFRTGDGAMGWQDQAPFDRIIVAAAVDTLPQPLVDQLSDNGIMTIPVGAIGGYQVLTTVQRSCSIVRTRPGIDCRFVPMRTSMPSMPATSYEDLT